jgi:uncharacterized protein YkwD
MMITLKKFINIRLYIVLILILVFILTQCAFYNKNIKDYINKEYSYFEKEYGSHSEAIENNNGITWYIFNDLSYSEQTHVVVRNNVIKMIYQKRINPYNRYQKFINSISGFIKEKLVHKNEICTINLLEKYSPNNSKTILFFDKKINEEFEIYFNNIQTYKKVMLQLINFERESRGIKKLYYFYEIDKVTQKYANYLNSNNYFSHFSKTNDSITDRLSEINTQYDTLSENLVRGKEISPYIAHNMLLNSQSHFLNMIDKDMSFIGIGVSKNDENYLVICQNFLGK